MGNLFLDQYSILHYATGVIAYFWGVPVGYFFVGHVAFEVAENTESGMSFINNNLTWWPGGKPKADTITNVLGDNVAALFGFYCAYKLDQMGKRNKWYV